MEMFRVTDPQGVKFGPGVVLKLTKEQARARLACLKGLPGGKYQVEKQVQFKLGEELGVGGDVVKSVMGRLAAIKSKKKEQANKKASKVEGGVSSDKNEPDKAEKKSLADKVKDVFSGRDSDEPGTKSEASGGDESETTDGSEAGEPDQGKTGEKGA